LHDFQLTPADMKLLSTADVFIINGGGIESFMEEIATQYPDLVIIEASDGLELLCGENEAHADHDHDHGDMNAHAWMSVELYRQQIANIAAGLARADEMNSASYLANANKYDGKLSELQQLQEEVRQFMPEHSEAVLLHNAYAYLAQDFDMEVAFSMDLDEERQVSAGEVAQVIEAIRHHGVQYIFAEELYAKDMCNLIQKEVDVEIIYLDPLTRGEYKADSYLDAMGENIERIKDAIRK
jgi:zinc transport system substrate-binding protein